MGNIFFFPRLIGDLVKEAGYKASEYEFSYVSPSGEECKLEIKKSRIATVSDPADVWQLREDGLILEKTAIIEYPEVLKGAGSDERASGVVPSEAHVLPYILWTSQKLSLTGVIKPAEIMESPRLACRFRHKFAPGTLDSDLTLELVLAVSKPAALIKPGEENLMNEPGVLLGDLEKPLSVDFDGDSMDFPIEEFKDQGGPLWRLQFEPWSDPREDLFSSASFSLLLNAGHPDCPRIVGGAVSNQVLLQEILSEAYFLIFEKVRDFPDEKVWDDMISDTDLIPGSVCSVLHWFSQRGEIPFDWTTPEGRMLSIKRIVDQSFAAGDTDE